MSIQITNWLKDTPENMEGLEQERKRIGDGTIKYRDRYKNSEIALFRFKKDLEREGNVESKTTEKLRRINMFEGYLKVIDLLKKGG